MFIVPFITPFLPNIHNLSFNSKIPLCFLSFLSVSKPISITIITIPFCQHPSLVQNAGHIKQLTQAQMPVVQARIWSGSGARQRSTKMAVNEQRNAEKQAQHYSGREVVQDRGLQKTTDPCVY